MGEVDTSATNLNAYCIQDFAGFLVNLSLVGSRDEEILQGRRLRLPTDGMATDEVALQFLESCQQSLATDENDNKPVLSRVGNNQSVFPGMSVVGIVD